MLDPAVASYTVHVRYYERTCPRGPALYYMTWGWGLAPVNLQNLGVEVQSSSFLLLPPTHVDLKTNKVVTHVSESPLNKKTFVCRE